jgi:hypothetical protein
VVGDAQTDSRESYGNGNATITNNVVQGQPISTAWSIVLGPECQNTSTPADYDRVRADE